MPEFDDYGFIRDRPVPPQRWAEALKGAPPGRRIIQNTIPPGVLVVQNYFAPAWCDALTRECDAARSIRHTVGELGGDDGFAEAETEHRTSEAITAQQLSVDIVAAVRSFWTTVVGPHYGANIEWFEEPEILKYGIGGEYKVHADSEIWDQPAKKWKRVLDRDVSILAYINSDFEGGELVFPNFRFGLKPARGMVVAFPSDGRYLHWAKPVTAGTRYAIVSWAAVEGGPRAHNAPPFNAIRM